MCSYEDSGVHSQNDVLNQYNSIQERVSDKSWASRSGFHCLLAMYAPVVQSSVMRISKIGVPQGLKPRFFWFGDAALGCCSTSRQRPRHCCAELDKAPIRLERLVARIAEEQQ